MLQFCLVNVRSLVAYLLPLPLSYLKKENWQAQGRNQKPKRIPLHMNSYNLQIHIFFEFIYVNSYNLWIHIIRIISSSIVHISMGTTTLTLFSNFWYLDEKMYLGRWLFPLATFFLRYLLVIIHLSWIELTSNHFHLSHSYMSNWYPTTRLYEFVQTRSALSLYKVIHTNCSVFNYTSYHTPIDIIIGYYRSWL